MFGNLSTDTHVKPNYEAIQWWCCTKHFGNTQFLVLTEGKVTYVVIYNMCGIYDQQFINIYLIFYILIARNHFSIYENNHDLYRQSICM